jgi:WD40 repeat protein
MRYLSLLLLLLTLSRPACAQTNPKLVLNTGGPQGRVSSIVTSRDGKWILAASYDKVIRIWNADTGLLTDEIRGEQSDGMEGQIYTMDLSPDGRWLAVGGFMRTDVTKSESYIRLYDFQQRKLVALLKGHTNVVNSVDFSDDGRFLASGSADNSVRLWSIPKDGQSIPTTPQRTYTGHTDNVCDVAMHGSLIVSVSYDKALRFWDINKSTATMTKTHHSDKCSSVAISPDGQTIISGGWDKQLHIYNRSGQLLQTIDNQVDPTVIRFSPNGYRFYCGLSSNGTFSVCNLYLLEDGQWTQERQKMGGALVKAVAFLDNRTVLQGSDFGFIQQFDVADGSYIRGWRGEGESVLAVGIKENQLGYTNQFSGVLGTSKITKYFDLSERRLESVNRQHSFSPPVRERGGYLLFHGAGGPLGFNDAILALRRVSDGQILTTITRNAYNGFRHRCYCFGPGQTIFSGGSDGALTAYDFSGRGIAQLIGHTGEVWGINISPDGKWLVSGSSDETIKLWSLAEIGRKAKIEPTLTLFVGKDGEWVLWHPLGYYDASLNGEKYIGWHINRGHDQIADYYPATSLRQRFLRPQFITALVETGSLDAAKQTLKDGQLVEVAKLQPPSVQWQTPTERNTTSDSPTMRVGVRVQSASALQLVRFLVNGRNGGGERGFKVAASGQLIEQTLRLQPGKNTVEVIVRNADAEVTSGKRFITYTPPAADAEPAKPILYVLGIGVSTYKDPAFSLSYAHQDALDLTAMLKRQQGGLYEQVVLQTLTNADATQQNIKAAFERLKQQATQRDLIVILMAGHGKTTPAGTFYFLPHEMDAKDIETTGLAQADILEALGTFPAKVVLFLDACHAGGIAQGPRFVSRSLEPNLSEFVRELISGTVGVAVFCASQPKEESLESRDFANGAFTEALLEGLMGKANSDNNEVVTINELDSYITKRVRQLTENRQTPGLYKPNAIPDFPLVVPGR